MAQIWVVAPFDYEYPDVWQRVWESNLRNGFISVGWRALKNVSRLSEVEIYNRHRKAWPDAKERGANSDSKVLFKFWNDLYVGDTIVARRGRKSIAAIGNIKNAPYYDPEKARQSFSPEPAYPNHIDVEWNAEPRDAMFAKQVFGMQTIHTISESDLKKLLDSAVTEGVGYPDEIEATEFYEGAVKRSVVNAYERDPKARAACQKHHGYRCSACGMLFAEAYGEIGIDFIHVHHLNPLAARKKSYKVHPINELAPVCPNCHAMLHTKKPPLTINRLRKLLAIHRSETTE